MLEVGKEAPEFELEDQNGNMVSLSDFAGQYVVLYFYPKAKTQGCTTEAQEFRDQYQEFVERNVPVLGVSADPVAELREFAEEENLPFRLLSDPDGEIASAYESFGEREIRGETWEIPFRNTYLLDPDGVIKAVYEDVSPNEHPSHVLEDLDGTEEAPP